MDDSADSILAGLEIDVPLRWYRRQLGFLRAAELFEAEGRSDDACRSRWSALAFSFPARVPDLRTRAGRFQRVGYLEDGTPLLPLSSIPDAALQYYADARAITGNPTHAARYADLRWERLGCYEDAVAAMDAYTGMAERLLLEDPPTEESERDFAVADALLRAVELSVLLSHDGTAQLCQTAADVACEFSRVGSTAAALEILEPLLSHDRTRGLLRLSPVSAAIGGAVQSHAAEAGQEHRHFERRWMALCARVDRAKTDPDAERNLMTAIAASFEREGDTILATREHANLIAADAYGSAIEALKQIPDTRSEVDRLQVKLDQCVEAAREDVGTIVHRIELDPDQVTAAKAQLEAAVSQYGLRALGDRFFMPQISEMRRAADEALKTTPLLARIQHVTFGGGRLLGRDSTYEERVEWYAMTSVLRALLCTASQVVPWAVDFLRVGGALTGAAMAQALDGADLIAEWRRDLIVHAFQRYIEGDYVSAVHIWVFQIEGVLRDTACRLGRPAMRTDKEGLTRARDLGNLLRDPAVVDLLGEDRVASLKAVLCERDVMNLRNEIAHGLATPEAFTRDVANLVLLLVLSFTPFQAQGGDADDQPAPPPE